MKWYFYSKKKRKNVILRHAIWCKYDCDHTYIIHVPSGSLRLLERSKNLHFTVLLFAKCHLLLLCSSNVLFSEVPTTFRSHQFYGAQISAKRLKKSMENHPRRYIHAWVSTQWSDVLCTTHTSQGFPSQKRPEKFQIPNIKQFYLQNPRLSV